MASEFTSEFLQAQAAPPHLPKGISPLVFLGTPYCLLPETKEELLTILSGGMVEAKEEYAFSLHALNCRILLYTRSGSGVLRLPKKTYKLLPGTLLYLDPSSLPLWEIGLSDIAWKYTVFFIRGKELPYYESLVSFSTALLISIPSYSSVLTGLDNLVHAQTDASLRNKLMDAGTLTNILTRVLIDGLPFEKEQKKIPSYLIEIRQSLDNFFMNPFRLEDLEEQYHISKYRICREFSASFGLPPLKYLNKRRMEAAKNLLQTSDKLIHEIANEVGFENTNHFINLFKKETGLTPLVYRDTISS